MLSHPLRIVTIPAAAIALIALTGCAPSAAPSDAVPSDAPASAPASASASAADPEMTTFSFDDGTSLTEDAVIGWGDGLRDDPGWKKNESMDAPGRFVYDNAADTCTATFGLAELPDMQGMTDREASDDLVSRALGESPTEFGSTGYDGIFLRNDDGQSTVAHRQFSVTVNGIGLFSAARAFVSANRGVSLLVSCEGPEIATVAHEVLTKSAVVLR